VDEDAAALQDELSRLRAENARLRDLLGLDTRESGGHVAAWSPTLLQTTESGLQVVDESSSEFEKVALLRTLFCARSDVYAVRWESTSTGKVGWSPATQGGWSGRRSRTDYLSLTDEVLTKHLRGRVAVGIYPLLRGDLCTLLACDFDKGTWVLDALAYLDACHVHGVPAVLERSRSGNGGHVWVFFNGAVSCR
jgi:hypothetical protein